MSLAYSIVTHLSVGKGCWGQMGCAASPPPWSWTDALLWFLAIMTTAYALTWLITKLQEKNENEKEK